MANIFIMFKYMLATHDYFFSVDTILKYVFNLFPFSKTSTMRIAFLSSTWKTVDFKKLTQTQTPALLETTQINVIMLSSWEVPSGWIGYVVDLLQWGWWCQQKGYNFKIFWLFLGDSSIGLSFLPRSPSIYRNVSSEGTNLLKIDVSIIDVLIG